MATKSAVIDFSSTKKRPSMSRRCAVIGRKNGDEHNVFCVECNMFDMTVYVDLLRNIEKGLIDVDYFIVEPLTVDELFNKSDYAF